MQDIIKKYALQNAILHNGKADEKAVISKVLAELPELRQRAKEIIPLVKQIVSEINFLTEEQQKNELEKIAPELLIKEKKEKKFVLPELKNAEKGVVMRLAPYPSGPLHIGNARMVILNDEYVKKYNGKLFLVYDDTIGSEEKIPVIDAYNLIKDDLNWLGVKVHEIFYKSNRMEIFYEWAEKIIEKEQAYVCECNAEKLRENRERGEECIHRNASKETTLEKWKKILNGGYKEGQAVLRLKTNMQHKNPAFRDRVLFRIVEREHPLVKDKYRVYPLLEFSWAVDDYLLGITHILRGKDLVIEDEMELYIWNLLKLEKREILHYGMLKLAEAKLSKSKSLKEVQSGEFSGWDDPRTWSLQSLRKRGISPIAIRNFILSFGMSLADIEVPAENLYAENKKIIDGIAKRFFFVANPIKIIIENLPEIKEVEIPNHPKNDLGKRKIKTAKEVFISKEDYEKFKGKEIRLKDFCNVILENDLEISNEKIAEKTGVHGLKFEKNKELNELKNSNPKQKNEIQSKEVEVKKAIFTSLLNKEIPKIQWTCEKFEVNVVMPNGEVIKGFGEENLRNVREDCVVQFERFGFVRIDKVENELIAYFGHK